MLLVGHVFLSRSRYGWHLTAIGASRKAARHAGIRVERMLFATYVLSGMLCAAGGIFYAARQDSTDSTTGVGWEFQALTAVVLGGVSLAGGKGTVWRAMIGGIIIFMLTNGLVRMGIPGYVTSARHRRHPARRRRHRRQMVEEPRQGGRRRSMSIRRGVPLGAGAVDRSAAAARRMPRTTA